MLRELSDVVKDPVITEATHSKANRADEEVQIYTWPDATLRELSDLVKEVRIMRSLTSACSTYKAKPARWMTRSTRRWPDATAAGAVAPAEKGMFL